MAETILVTCETCGKELCRRQDGQPYPRKGQLRLSAIKLHKYQPNGRIADVPSVELAASGKARDFCNETCFAIWIRSELERQVSAITQGNPHFTEEDFESFGAALERRNRK